VYLTVGMRVSQELTGGYRLKREAGHLSVSLSPEESVAEVRRVIDGLTLGQSARFLSYDGSEVPW